jgi:hypothetical protein
MSSFRAAGVCQLNPDVFTEIEFEKNEETNWLIRNLKETVMQRLLWRRKSKDKLWRHLNHSLVLSEL